VGVAPCGVSADADARFGRAPHRAIAETPVVAGCSRREREWRWRVERDFSFSSRAYAGDRWPARRDAGCSGSGVLDRRSDCARVGARGREGSGEGLPPATSRSEVRRLSRRQHQRYRSFRRFVFGFYTPSSAICSSTTIRRSHVPARSSWCFAGYWKPSLPTRAWVALFFLLVRLQQYVPIAPRLFSAGRPSAEAGCCSLTPS